MIVIVQNANNICVIMLFDIMLFDKNMKIVYQSSKTRDIGQPGKHKHPCHIYIGRLRLATFPVVRPIPFRSAE